VYYNLKLIPVHQWTHREFDGFDPWAGNRPVQWSLVAYRMVAKSFADAVPIAKPTVPSTSNDVPKHLAIGIFARAHNRYRVLPLALQDLWRAGKVRDVDLPGLLHRIEGPLHVSDYPPGRLPIGTRLYGFLCSGVALLGLAGLTVKDGDVRWVAFWTVTFTIPIAILCFGVTLYWQRRRRQLADTWLAMLQGIEPAG
jgi:hypothetical protein